MPLHFCLTQGEEIGRESSVPLCHSGMEAHSCHAVAIFQSLRALLILYLLS